MKKLFFIFIVICLLLSGCSKREKRVVSLEEFNTVLINNGFTTIDNMDFYKDDRDYIDGAIKGSISDDLVIEMVKYYNVDDTKKVHNGHIANFDLLKTTGTYEDKDKGVNYYRYVLISNNRYMISTRVDNTLIFCKTMLENKDIVEKVFNEIGY